MDPRETYCQFLRDLQLRQITVERWNSLVVARQADPQLEHAARRLRTYAVLAGQCSHAPGPPGIETLAAELLEELTN